MNNIQTSIIIPTRNEEGYLENTIYSLIKGDYPLINMEIIIVDGMSDDKTIEVARKLEKKFTQIILLNNPEKTVPYAMNYGIERAVGSVIIRLDAHSIYPNDYVSQLVYWLEKLGADNVGGAVNTIPANDSLEAQAIAYSTSQTFGVGNSQFRISNKNQPYEVDTVPFGCYKKKVFYEIGLYDEDLTRNQDDELNGRLIENGGKIFLIPNLKIKYFARDKMFKMFKMFYQYGYYKPLVNTKLRKPATIRQFAPPSFVLFLITGTLLSIINHDFVLFFFSGFSFYCVVNIIYSYKISQQHDNLFLFPYLICSFFLIHISYGTGYLRGILDFMFLKKHTKNKLHKVHISR